MSCFPCPRRVTPADRTTQTKDKSRKGGQRQHVRGDTRDIRGLETAGAQNPACWIADEHKVNYGEHNPFDIFAASLVPIYKEDKMCGLSIEADPGYSYNYCVGVPAIQMPNALTGPAAPLNS